MGVFDVDYSKVKELDYMPYSVDITDHKWITLSDGTRLSAKIWQPHGMEQSKGTILEYLPYRKDDFTALRDEIRHKYFAGHGFTSIRIDIRGTGDSDGILFDEYTEQEQLDGIEVIDWITKQPWSNGHVGMIGKSWGGFNGLQLAARQPEALKAVISLCSTDDRYADDVHYRGGVLMASEMLWWASTMFAYNGRPAFHQFVGGDWYKNWLARMDQTPPYVEEWVSHQTRDAFWKHGSICEDYSKVKIPVLTLSGWADGYTNAVDRLYNNLESPKKAIIGPWAHEFPDIAIPGPNFGYLQECIAWFEKWFVDDQSSVEHTDTYSIYLQNSVKPQTSYDYREGVWLDYKNATTQNIDVLGPQNEIIRIKNNIEHGMYGGVFCPFGQDGEMPGDQTSENGLATTLRVDFGDELRIGGQPIAKLRLKSNVKEANIHVRLTDVHPDGQRTLITKGQLNLNHYKSHEFPEDLPIDSYIDVEFKLDIIGYVLPKDHKLEISLSPSYWPLMWPSKEIADLTVDLGGSQLLIPHLTQFDEIKPQFEKIEMATPLPKEVIEEGSRTREIRHDLVNDVWTIDDYAKEGLRTLPHLGITYGTVNHNTYALKNGDPLSATVTSDWDITVSDRDIDTRTVTHSKMSCDADNFYLYNEIIGYNEGSRVFFKSWNKTIPRMFN
ncbi:CocE/NonD family hydrolase [Aerococcaceae bacterium DSM 111022]|nr:CocE/NonD family hydrolase [Aerococcaceae bacterium DSM 111022]